jgi:hypothetical protein
MERRRRRRRNMMAGGGADTTVTGGRLVYGSSSYLDEVKRSTAMAFLSAGSSGALGSSSNSIGMTVGATGGSGSATGGGSSSSRSSRPFLRSGSRIRFGSEPFLSRYEDQPEETGGAAYYRSRGHNSYWRN